MKMKVVYLQGNSNGNCLFRSCSYHLGVDQYKLRQQISDVILNYPHLPINGSLLSEWLSWINYDHVNYSNYIAKDGVYGTAIELMLISIMYRRCIRVMNIKSEMIAEYFPEFGNAFYLMFSGPASGGHYNPLE
jgi:hypothetical protein